VKSAILNHVAPDKMDHVKTRVVSFRQPGFEKTIRGRSWAIHDGVVSKIDDDILDEGWYSPKMYLLVGQPRTATTFPDAVY